MRTRLMLACLLAAHSVAMGASPAPAEPAKLASKSLLIDVTAAGNRLIAVGERGHVLLSDDDGKSWTQAKQVPVQALQTGVCFFDAQHGIAVGHDETILSTADAGNTWTIRQNAPERQQPLLDVWCGESGHALAVGAYSAFYESRDQGKTWTARALDAKPLRDTTAQLGTSVPSAANADSQPDSAPASQDEYDDGLQQDYHFNRIVGASASRLYIAAEAGRIYRSDDAGASWIELSSPYEGSFFGALALSQNEVLVFGLRGNLYRSSDAGESWRKIQTRTVAMLNDAVKLDNKHIAVVGLSGVVLLSGDGGRTFTTNEQADRKGFSAAWPVNASTLALVGEGGARLLDLSRELSASRTNPAASSGALAVRGGR